MTQIQADLSFDTISLTQDPKYASLETLYSFQTIDQRFSIGESESYTTAPDKSPLRREEQILIFLDFEYTLEGRLESSTKTGWIESQVALFVGSWVTVPCKTC